MPNLFLWFALAIAGACIGLSADFPVVGGALLASLATIGGALVRRRGLRALSVLVCAASVPWMGATLQRQQHEAIVRQLPLEPSVVIEGVVTDIRHTRSSGQRWRLRTSGALIGPPAEAERRAMRGTVDVNVLPRAGRLDVKPGDRVRLRTRLRPLSAPDTPGAFDEQRFGLARAFHARASVSHRDDVAVVHVGEEHQIWAEFRLQLRERLLAVGTPHEAGVLLALLIGDTSLFDQETLELYRRVGAGHLLAVSGLQVSLIAWLLFQILQKLCLLWPSLFVREHARHLATVFALAGVWGFVALCGVPPSAVRAAGMASVGLCVLLVGRRWSAFETLSLAGFITVSYAPASVWDPSFLLSYAAVFGLVLSIPREGDPRRPALAQLVLSSLAAGATTLPISAYLFGELALGGLLSNLVLVPVASLVQVPALSLGLAGALLEQGWMVSLGALAAGTLEALCMVFDGWVGGVVPITAPSAVSTLGFVMASAAWVAGSRTGQLRRGLVVATISACLAISPRFQTPPGVRVTALPVGQGDGLVVEFPSGQVMLVDGGGLWDERRDPGTDVVIPFLRRRGIHHIDVVALSHPHPDHALGLLPVLSSFPVGELWHSGYGRDHPLMARVLRAARDRQVVVRDSVDLLGAHRFGDARVEVLAPFPEDGDTLYEELHENDNSLVFRIVLGQDRFLFTGDIERWGEAYLLDSGVDVAAQVVKAPHHGSRTSSSPALVRATKAEHVLFLTEKGNQFGFPHPEVAERWEDAGARTWDTAKHGEISVWLTGNGVSVRAHRPE